MHCKKECHDNMTIFLHKYTSGILRVEVKFIKQFNIFRLILISAIRKWSLPAETFMCMCASVFMKRCTSCSRLSCFSPLLLIYGLLFLLLTVHIYAAVIQSM